jgi:hypothetical protein
MDVVATIAAATRRVRSKDLEGATEGGLSFFLVDRLPG